MKLEDLMNDIAGEVRTVDLSDRVRASSRRLAVRRTALTAAGVFVAVVTVSGVVWAGLPHGSGPPEPPIVDRPTTGVPATTAPTAGVPATTPSTPSAGGSPVWTKIPETLYYVSFDGQTHLRVLRGGTVKETVTAGCALGVSPDGSRLMWGTSDGATPGDLVVAGVDGSGRRTLLRGIDCQGGSGPFWMPDSRHLLVTRAEPRTRVLVDVTGGKVLHTPFASTEEYLAWSPSGTVVAYQSHHEIVVAHPDGSVIRRVTHGDETPSGGFSLQGISDDGRYAVVGDLNSDPGQVRYGFQLVDTVTGKNVAAPAGIPSGGRRKPAIYPLAGGRLLFRVAPGRLYLAGPDGTILDRRTEPAGLDGTDLLLIPGRR